MESAWPALEATTHEGKRLEVSKTCRKGGGSSPSLRTIVVFSKEVYEVKSPISEKELALSLRRCIAAQHGLDTIDVELDEDYNTRRPLRRTTLEQARKISDIRSTLPYGKRRV